jgi:hypothetical protein
VQPEIHIISTILFGHKNNTCSIENMAQTNVENINIEWPCDAVVPSRKCENAVIQVLHRKDEWGRGRDLPQRRLDEIQSVCDQNHMTLYQALSLRRTMLRSFPNGMQRVNNSAQMGSNQGQTQVASLFEDAVTSFVAEAIRPMSSKHVFLTEAEQLAEMRLGTRARGPTPDILFINPVRINRRLVKWIDAKMYYASMRYATHKKVPNGKLQKIADRYNNYFGCEGGAFVFGQGFCADLNQVLTRVLLLDSSGLDMTAVNEFQDSS